MQVVVVGGGVIGCAVAYFLRREGLGVTLVEQGRIGQAASAAAAGMLAPSAESVNTGPLQGLARAGLQAFERYHAEISSESGIDFEFRRDGVLRIAESDEEAISLRKTLARQATGDLTAHWLDRVDLKSLEPNLSEDVTGAILAPGEAHVNPLRFTEALAAAASRRGARLLEGCTAEAFETDGNRVAAIRHHGGRIEADYFVIANGAWAGLWQQKLGVPTPIFPVRGQMAAISLLPPPIRHVVFSRSGYLVPKADGSIYVGATEEEEAGYNPSVTTEGLRWLLASAERLVPALADGVYLRSWAGLRPCSRDRLPLLGPLPPFSNLALACGHFRNGILFSLVTGEIIARQLAGGQAVAELQPFSPARFQ